MKKDFTQQELDQAQQELIEVEQDLKTLKHEVDRSDRFVRYGWFVLLPIGIVMGFMLPNPVWGMIQIFLCASLLWMKIYLNRGRKKS